MPFAIRSTLQHARTAARALTILALAAATTASAAAQTPAGDDLTRLSIEELMQIDITLASRQAAPVGTAAAAVSVLTGDDLRRSGATTIADALALADGLHVARFNTGTWAISARGFNTNTANKMLVMVDGRTVYSPLFTGVFWNTVDYVLADIDRIEIIRGPGATLWGANAVNGVINIVTRSAGDTQGGYASVTVGDEDPLVAAVRYGGRRRGAAWRLYAKAAGRDAQRLVTGASAADARERGQAGFRADGGDADGVNWMVKGDAFHSRDHLLNRPTGEFTDLALQGRWSAPGWSRSRVTIQSYYRREYRRIPQQLTHHIDVADIDAQQAATWGNRHSVVWGGGLRVNWDGTLAGPTLSFDPPSRRYGVGNVFAQDEVSILPQRLDVTLGAKWERNAFSGGEIQPNVRGRLLLPRRQILWSAVSRAVRRPTRFEEDLVIRAPTGAVLVRGDDTFRSERLIASEVGYRIVPWSPVSIDATLFHHDYDHLRSQDLPPDGRFPLRIGNSLRGRSRGLELAVNVQPLPAWRTHVSYTWLDVHIERAPGSRDVSGGTSEANDPRHMFSVRTSIDLPGRVEVDAHLRSIGRLVTLPVPAYTELNARVAWRATRRIEPFFAGQDLLHASHAEFNSPGAIVETFARSIRAGAALRF